jgi:DNA-binding transcriptional ArsR family regulator
MRQIALIRRLVMFRAAPLPADYRANRSPNSTAEYVAPVLPPPLLASYKAIWLNNRKVQWRMPTDRLSRIFSALADPTRRAILSRLTDGEASVGELSEPFRMSQPAISKHLKVLERAGLIAKSTHAQWRLCRLEAAPLREVADWMEPYRRFWDESFSRLDEHLRHMQRDKERNER